MTDTTDAPSRAFLIIREVLATPTTATADTIGDKTAARIEQRLKAAGLLVDAPTEEQIERAARAIFEEERNVANEPWPVWDELGEPTQTFDPKDPYRDLARAALTAATGVAPQEPSAHVNPVATSGACAKN